MNTRTLTDSAHAELVSLYQGQEINRVLEKVELHLKERILDPRLFTLKGVCEQQTGNLKGAADAFSRAIELDPDYTDALINLGLVKKLLGDSFRNQVPVLGQEIPEFCKPTEFPPIGK